MSILSNKDLVFEISNYLLHFDLRRLKLAFPEIIIPPKIYKNKRSKLYLFIPLSVKSGYLKLDQLLSCYICNFAPELCLYSSDEEMTYSLNFPEDLFKIFIGRKQLLTDKFCQYLYAYLDTGEKIIFTNSSQLLDLAYKLNFVSPTPYFGCGYSDIDRVANWFSGMVVTDYLKLVIKYCSDNFSETKLDLIIKKLNDSDKKLFVSLLKENDL